MRRINYILVTLFIFVLHASATAADQIKPQWQHEWNKVLEGAKKEGRVVVSGGEMYVEVFAEFQKRYPDIKVVSISGNSTQLLPRIITERRAEKYLVDISLSGPGSMYNVLHKAKALDPIKPALILPEVLDESKWWKGKHRYGDEEDQYIFAFNLVPVYTWAYNTKLVNPSEIKSYWDLLQPKWKGKILLMDPTLQNSLEHLRFHYYNPELGPEFIRRLLTEMDVTASRDIRQIADWLATGKFALTGITQVSRTRLDVAKKQGLPVDWFGAPQLKEGVPLGNQGGCVALLNRAPHPNAARVAINWLLSREGQMIFQKVRGDADSLRIDIPKDGIASHARRVEGPNYHLPDERVDNAPILKFVNEVWKRKN